MAVLTAWATTPAVAKAKKTTAATKASKPAKDDDVGGKKGKSRTADKKPSDDDNERKNAKHADDKKSAHSGSAGKGAKGAKGAKGDKGAKAEKGDKGDHTAKDDEDDDKPLSAKEKKRLARQQAALRKSCAKKSNHDSKKCKDFLVQQKAAQEDAAQERLETYCEGKKARKSSKCKAILGKGGKVESDGCGRKYGRARKRDTVAKFASRYGVSESTVRHLNDLADSVKKLKAGKRLLIAKSPHDGVTLSGGVQLADNGDLRTRHGHLSWGKPLLVDMLREAAAVVQQQSPMAPRLLIGDLSKEGGGCLPPHKSHRGGLDVDVGYYFRGAYEPRYLVDARPRTIDADRSWQLLKALLLSGRVQYAFVHYSLQPALYEAALRAGDTPENLRRWMQYPRSVDQIHVAPLRHLDGHDDHFHLRLRCDGEGCGLSEAARNQVRAARIEVLGGPVREGRRGRRAAAATSSAMVTMR
jgi:hypothetical protein